MPAVDRAVLRLGCLRARLGARVPTAVVISEAVELAKQYSTKDSGRFVNGLLSRDRRGAPSRERERVTDRAGRDPGARVDRGDHGRPTSRGS